MKGSIHLALTLEGGIKQNGIECQGIISKATELTDWANALIVVEKPCTRELHICLDLHDLNKAIKRPHYPLPIH